MKLFATEEQLLDLTPREAEWIALWKKRKHYPTTALTIGEVMELILAYSFNLHHDDSLYVEGESFFDHILRNRESVVAWQGEELFDILFYELRVVLKKRLSQARTFNDEEVII